MTPFDRLLQIRDTYPQLMTDAQLGEMLNRLAWEYKDDGMRLLGKPGGRNIPQPFTGRLISSDYLVHRDTLTGHDVLTDNGTATDPPTHNGIVLGFEWGPGPEPLADAIGSGARSVVDPVNPGDSIPTPPEVDPPSVPDSTVEDAVVGAFRHFDQRLTEQDAALSNLTQQVVDLHARIQWNTDALVVVAKKMDRTYHGNIRYLGGFDLTPVEKE